MSVWLSSHGAGAINASENSFVITANGTGALVRPSNANKLNGDILFLLPCLPPDVSRLARVAVDFSSHTAYVTDVAIMSGNNVVFQKKNLEKTGAFEVQIFGNSAQLEPGNGLALSVGLMFETVSAKLRFHSVGLEVDVAPPRPVQSVRFATGHWSIGDVRPWNQPRAKTEGHITFPTPFSSPPTVVVSMTGADVDNNANFRVRVYATGVSSHGFDMHADTWGSTTLYSCDASWIAIGS